MILHPSAEPIADSLRGLHIEHSIHSINTLAAVAARYEAQLLVEDLPRTCLCNTSGEMLSIFERLDPAVGVCFDTNHLLQESPEAFARALGGRIASLHVSDYDAVDEKHWLMGRGTIDWPESGHSAGRHRLRGRIPLRSGRLRLVPGGCREAGMN